MSLIEDLQAAHMKADPNACGACAALDMPNLDEETREQLASALAGTIGVKTLAEILRRNGITGAGRRTIDRHRKERHRQP